jgi:hypothetical protein
MGFESIHKDEQKEELSLNMRVGLFFIELQITVNLSDPGRRLEHSPTEKADLRDIDLVTSAK